MSIKTAVDIKKMLLVSSYKKVCNEQICKKMARGRKYAMKHKLLT